MAHLTNQKRSTFVGLTKGGSLPEFELSAAPPLPAPAVREYTSSTYTSGTKTCRINGHSTAGRQAPTVQLPDKVSALPLWKRILDIACVLLTAPLWLPLMILLAVWIKTVSSGPVFFRQTRVGLGTRTFTMLKFRSMKTGAETNSHENHFRSLVENGVPMTKLDSLQDRRIIFGGRLLRATGLDELPQLFNVLRGEMSLVGPRPCIPRELDCYTGWQKARFNVVPGITGYWQVNGKNKTTFNQMVEMDIQYGERMSPLFDLIIILGTLPALAMQAVEARWQKAGSSPAGAMAAEAADAPPVESV